MGTSKRSKFLIKLLKSDQERPKKIFARPIKTSYSRSNSVYVIVGVPLIGLITTLLIFGAFALRRRVTTDPLSVSVAAQGITTEQATLQPTSAAQLIPATSSATVSPSPTNAPTITVLPTNNPTATYICMESQGQVLDKTFNSTVAHGVVPYRIYLPPCYAQTNRRYPYVILLHGAGSDQTEWTDMLGVNQTLDQGIVMGNLPPMILVMPYGGFLEYYNQFTAGQSFESLILNDLMPEIENNYCTWNAQAGRALAGISRGGFWVFEIGFRYPELFGALAGHSPYFDLTNAPAAYNPLDLAQAVTFAPNTAPRLWLDVAGDDADTRQGLDVFAETLLERNIDPGYTIYPTGEHVEAYWKSHLQEYLTFYGRDWPINPMLLPLCTR